MKTRSQIEEKYKWDLSKFCANDEDFYDLLAKIEKHCAEFKKFEGKLSDNKVLLKYLNFKSDVLVQAGKTSYAFLRQCEDGSDRKANDMMEKRSIVVSKLSRALTPLESEIDRFSVAHLKELQHDRKFEVYKRYFEATIRHKKHALSKKEEMLLANLGESFGGASDTFDRFNDVDLKFDPILDSKGKLHEFSQSNYSVFVESQDRKLRENAFRQINAKHGEFVHTLATNYINTVKEDCVLAKVRKYKSALAQSIFGEEASEKVYEMLIKKVRENVSVLEEYFQIKQKLLGLDDFAIYDVFAPLSKSTKTYSYDQAIDLVKEAVSVLGSEYVDLIQRAKDERWIDVFPNKNKRSGAFCSGCEKVTPVVLVNFEGDLNSVFTLAHELGHAMHTYFSNKNQPVQTSDYTIFVAEVASITNEMLLLNLLLKKAKSSAEKICLYDKFLSEVRTTIFRQTMFAEFEEFAHAEYEKENPLSAELLCEKYEQLNNFYHGKKVKQIPEMKYEWARIPHFFDSFYVYKYATGMICAIKISQALLKDQNFAKKYLKFLSSGCSQDPISLLKIADCDLEKEEVFDQTFDICRDYVKNMKECLK